MSIKYIQLPVCKLSAFTAAATTSFDVSGFLYNDGVTAVAAADIGDICYATLEPKTAREELISFTISSVTAGGVATLTVTRGLSQKSPYGTGGASFDHQAGSDLVISNNPGLFNKLAAKANDETVTGSWAFPATPTTTTNPVTKGHFDTHAVIKTTNQTIAGVKTFSDPAVFSDTVTIPDAVADTEAASKGQTEAYADALDADSVKDTGDETIAGVKTFSSSPVVPDATAANQPYTKGQHDADAEASSAVASPTVRGSAKLDTVADTPLDPEVLTATADRAAAIQGTSGTPSSTNKFVTDNDTSDVHVASKVVRLTAGAEGTSYKLAASGSQTEIADNTTTETDIFSVSIPADMLSTANAITFKVFVKDFSAVGVTAGAATFRLKYGSTTLVTLTSTVPSTTSGPLLGTIEGIVSANASALAQNGFISIDLSENQLDPGIDFGSDTNTDFIKMRGAGTATEDSTGALDLDLTVQWAAGANSGNNFIPAGYVIELVS